MVEAILFDLDGTLLPMEQKQFTQAYFGALCAYTAPLGYNDAKKLIGAIWKGTEDMVRNDGRRTNEEVFWESFAHIFGEKVYGDKSLFDTFYATDFHAARNVCGFTENAATAVRKAKGMGCKVVLASNPIFPFVGQKSRIQWAGLIADDFDYITSYENSHYCKPNPEYYAEIADAIGCAPEHCLMIGNDASEDSSAEKIGMRFFLLTDCLINDKGLDISKYAQGDYDALQRYLSSL